jgi:hypothetical protein
MDTIKNYEKEKQNVVEKINEHAYCIEEVRCYYRSSKRQRLWGKYEWAYLKYKK